MVSVTLSPPSDWTLMGSISGLVMRMGGCGQCERVALESADGSPAHTRWQRVRKAGVRAPPAGWL